MIRVLFKAVIKARRCGLMRLTIADTPTRLDCLADKCALCCRTLGSPRATPEEAERIGAEHISRFGSGLFVKSSGSTCSLLTRGLCGMYDFRPRGCREYPWYNIDGRLYYDAGCPGILHDRDERPDVATIQPWENFFPDTGPIARWLLRRFCIVRWNQHG